MFGFFLKIFCVFLAICAVAAILESVFRDICRTVDDIRNLTSATKDKSYMPVIHYKRCMEENTEYLRKICPADSAAAKDRYQILFDFSYCDDPYFLLKSDKGTFYLRKYRTCSGSDKVTRYILENVKDGLARELKEPDSCLDRLCQKNLARSAEQLFISCKDDSRRGKFLNTYPIWYSSRIADPTVTAYKLETESVEAICAKADTNAKDDFSYGSAAGMDPGDPNQWGSEAWWEEQKKFIDESLYVNHDWDIFKKEEERCDAKNCHDPYHHHKK